MYYIFLDYVYALGLKFVVSFSIAPDTMEMTVAGHDRFAVGGFSKPAAAPTIMMGMAVIVGFIIVLITYLRCRAVSTMSAETQTDSATLPDERVYVTVYGEKYHCDQHCRGLRSRTTTLRSYTPCSICCEGDGHDVSSSAGTARRRSGNATGCV